MAHPPAGTPDGADDGAVDDGERDDLAALDFSTGADAVGETDLAVILGDYSPAADQDDAGVDFAIGDVRGRGEDPMPTFTVTNPPGTVTVTTFMDGRVHQIDLSPRVTSMTEHRLADEIVVIAGLATQDARSAQYTFMLEGMSEHGHDDAATRDFLSRELDLPTPEQAQAARAELFTTRYAGEE
ncbi:hypothetical protein H7K09_24975 [Mycolicibacterium duvalii]|uniref:ESX-1 secretion-associated protein EspH n=1 Tax=Mycolicibacterium duvalii TaxID=39688 RepID=A0A7I7K701_9MYCO|nr:hypothetical protein [Mycolicibacterium duvalii]BBX19344.1 hypothetical protein MDUV_42040 [Mycolicibacterium duvalii]